MTPTFLLGPRRGHDEGHYQVKRSQEGGGRAPRAPAAASRGLQTGSGGGGSGGGSCCFSSLLSHPCRPGAAALELRRGPSRRGGGGGAGAVVRTRAATPGTRAAPSPGLGLRVWVWGPCVRVSETVSHGRSLGISSEESKQRGRGSSTAGGHSENGHGPRVPDAGLRGAGHRLHRAVSCGPAR